MSHLALLSECSIAEEQPRIFSFLEFAAQRLPKNPASPGDRAKVEHRNRCCPICSRVTVETIELKNGRIGKNGRLIPGTGTLVGFSCNGCGHEWPV